MNSMIHSLKTSRRNRAILCDYRARDATRWSEEEKHAAKQRYKHRMRKNKAFEDDDFNTDLDNQMNISLSNAREREIMQKVAFTDGLLNQIKASASNYFDRYSPDSEHGILSSGNENQAIYIIQSTKYNESIAESILRKNIHVDSSNEDDDEHDKPPIYNNSQTALEHTMCLEEKVCNFISAKHLSQDKMCAI